jgi:translation initiation factor 3 subunit E
LYDLKVITRIKVKTIGKTNLIDLIEIAYEKYLEKYPNDNEMRQECQAQQPEWENRRNSIFDLIDNEPADVQKVSAFFEKAELLEELKTNNTPLTMEVLASHGLSAQAVDSYFRHGKFKYEAGMYNDAEQMLSHYISIIQPQNQTVLQARWGRLACRILSAKWESALEDLKSVKEMIDNRSTSPVDQIRQRAWFLHWALFVYINIRDGADLLADLFYEKVFLQTIENLCPWLLRYYVAFVILSSSRRRTMIKDVLNEVLQISYLYSDPLTQFLDALLNQFDFEEAQRKLAECQLVMKNDFFLQIFATEFEREARLLICETYCSIHHRVSLETLSTQLKVDVDTAEKWFVDMVMNAPTMDARVDCEAKEAIMVPQSRSTHEIVVEKSRDVAARSTTLANNLLNLLNEQAPLIKSRNGISLK